jgi:hypothetical protein
MIVRNAQDADVVVTLKNTYRQKPEPVRDAETRGVPVYVLRSNTGVQIDNVLTALFPRSHGPQQEEPEAEAAVAMADPGGVDPSIDALVEAEQAISRVIHGGPPASLTPQGSMIRRLQHELAERYNLASRSKGRDPYRHVEIYRRGAQ